MQMIEIQPLENGAHRNQTYNGFLPYGWALIREDVTTLENFPFGEVETAEIRGVPTVTSWTALPMPEEPPKQEAKNTAQDDIDAMLVDQEYRLTLLELGLSEGV